MWSECAGVPYTQSCYYPINVNNGWQVKRLQSKYLVNKPHTKYTHEVVSVDLWGSGIFCIRLIYQSSLMPISGCSWDWGMDCCSVITLRSDAEAAVALSRHCDIKRWSSNGTDLSALSPHHAYMKRRHSLCVWVCMTVRVWMFHVVWGGGCKNRMCVQCLCVCVGLPASI